MTSDPCLHQGAKEVKQNIIQTASGGRLFIFGVTGFSNDSAPNTYA